MSDLSGGGNEDNDKERVESASKQRIGVSFQNEKENGKWQIYAREWKSWSVKMQFYVTDYVNKMMMVVSGQPKDEDSLNAVSVETTSADMFASTLGFSRKRSRNEYEDIVADKLRDSAAVSESNPYNEFQVL